MTRWNYTKTVPDDIHVACSGGVDSIGAALVLSEWRKISLVHFHHGDSGADAELAVVEHLARMLGVTLLRASYTGSAFRANREAQWRRARYDWFHTLDKPVVTGHTLDDAVEWYMMTCLRGRGEFMPYANRNVIRPFLLTDKEKLVKVCNERGVGWHEDPTNADSSFALRNRVRSQLVPVAAEIEPGLRNIVKRRIVAKTLELDSKSIVC